MPLLDRDITTCQAMVVDGNPTSRSILAGQLRDFGVANVQQCSRIQDARRQLESRTFDIVLCEHRFDDECPGYTAQHLLDDLRRNQLLPLSTVFIIVTGEASYSMVAEAAESALDSYLLKPHTAAVLGERLTHARARKRALNDIFSAIEQQDLSTAAQLCQQRFQARSSYWLYTARIGAELLLRQGRHDEARALYEAVLGTGMVPWARLGIARSQLESQQAAQALRTLEGVIGDHPSYVEAFDMMARVQVEQGNLEDALGTFRKASALTPGSLVRLQKHGMLAMLLGQRDEGIKALERASVLGISSKMFDHQSLVLLAFSRFHQRDSKGLQRCLDNLQQALEKTPDATRLQRLVGVVQVLNLVLAQQIPQAMAAINSLFARLDDPELDLEAACNLLALVARLSANGLTLERAGTWVDTLGLRFSCSKGLTELLAAAAHHHPPFVQRIRDAQARIADLAETAVTHSLKGQHRSSVRALLQFAEETLNAKLIDMARMALQRHGDKIEDAAALSEKVEALRSRYPVATLNAGIGQSGVRQPGALNLRQEPSSAERQAA